jgi:uncharacterized protein (TIGR02246 family)
MIKKYAFSRGQSAGVVAASALTIALAGTTGTAGEDSQTSLGNDADSAAVRALIQTETDAWNRGDAHAFAARFAPDGSFTNVIGMVSYGKEEFERRHAEIFKTIFKGSVLKQSIDKLRFVRPDVAIVNINTEMTQFVAAPPGVRTEKDNAIRTKLELVLLKERGEWQITAFHNVAVTPLPPRS